MTAERAVINPSPSSEIYEKQLPWLWIVESLSTSKLVDSSFLNVLISKASQLTEDESFCEIAKEKLAVDHLEGLISGISTCNEENATFNSKSQSEMRLDECERAQDVLTRLLDIIGKSNTKVSLLESLKLDVRKFVLHKRAVLRTNNLQQLKSLIASTCSREMSELASRPNKNKFVDPEVLGAGNFSAKLFSQTGGSSEFEKQQDHRTNCSGADINGATTNCDPSMIEIQSLDKSLYHLHSEKENTLLQEDSRVKGLISTGERSPELNKIRGFGECKPGFDIVGDAADQSLEQGLKDGGVRLKHQSWAPLILENANEVLEDYPDSTLVSNEKQSSRFPELEQEDYLDKGNSCGDIGQLKSLRLNSTPLHVNGSVQDPSERVLVSREKEVSELAERILVHDMLGGVNFVDDGHGCECTASKKLKKSRDSKTQHTVEVTALSSKIGEKRACSSDSGMAIAAKKQKCLNFNNPLSRGSQVEGGPAEGNLCTKCNRSDGNLLICSVLSCRVVVHESCAGSSVNVMDSGKYQCPICSCVEALAVYRETKKKASLVKKKVLFHKNQVSEYMCMLNEQEQILSEVYPDKELIKNQREIENQVTIQSCTFVHSDDLHHRGLEVRSRNCGNGLNLEEKGKAQMIKDKPSEGEDRESTSSDDLCQRGGKKTTHHCENTSTMEETEKTKLVQDQLGVLEESNKSYATAKSASSTKPAAVCHIHTVVEKEIEDWKYTGGTRLRRSSPQLINVNKAAKEKDVISMDVKRRPKISTQLTISGRREKIAWSDEEVEILMEGVWKYSTNDGQTAPWTKVLQFGSHVFQRSRTAGDVKDKWRNIWSRGGGRRE